MKKGTAIPGILVGMIVLVWASPAARGATPAFRGLGYPSGEVQSFGIAVSDDGTAVAGMARVTDSSDNNPTRWTDSSGMVSLNPSGIVTGMSGDGTTIVGIGTETCAPGFAWRASTGYAAIPRLTATSGNQGYAEIWGVSRDGSVIVGNDHEANGRNEAIRWTPATGTVGLGFLPGYTYASDANVVSADGQTIIGSSRSSSSGVLAEWTQQTGLIPSARASGVFSSDLSISVRVATQGPQTGHVILWRQGAGETDIGMLSGCRMEGPTGVSDAGTVVIGRAADSNGLTVPWVWTPDRGMRPLGQMAAQELGLDLTGWRLFDASDISPNGTFITGSGMSPDGHDQAFLLTVPEPATLALLAVGGLAMTRRRRLGRP